MTVLLSTCILLIKSYYNFRYNCISQYEEKIVHSEHCVSIGISHVDEAFFLKIIVKGTLTHEDYEKMVPMMENALVGIKEPTIKVLVDARAFEGWDIRAAWDDLKFGLKHNKEFTKLAFVGHKEWEAHSIKISNWFMSGEMRYFEDMESAISWLNEEKRSVKNMDTMEKEFESRKSEILKELKFLFKANMKIADWDIPEPDNQEAAEILVNILQEGLDKIKEDIKNDNFIY